MNMHHPIWYGRDIQTSVAIEIWQPACMLVVPKIRTKRNGGRKCSYAAATLWNDLPSANLK